MAQKFSKSRFQQEFYLDEAILRRIQRVKQTQRTRDDMDVDDDEDAAGADASLVLGEERRVPGRIPKKERT